MNYEGRSRNFPNLPFYKINFTRKCPKQNRESEEEKKSPTDLVKDSVPATCSVGKLTWCFQHLIEVGTASETQFSDGNLPE